MRPEIDDLCLTEKLFTRPLTRTGWWAVGFEAAFVALFTAMVLWGNRARYGFDPVAGALAVLTGASAVAGGVAGGVGIVRKGERSLVLFLIVLVGLLVLLFAAGEFLEGK